VVPLEPTFGIVRGVDKAKLIIFSHLLAIITIPTHFIVCYWQLYSLCKTPNSAKFFLFFVLYSPTIILPFYAIFGYFETGVCGLYLAILFIPPNGGTVAFTANILMMLIWMATAIYFFL